MANTFLKRKWTLQRLWELYRDDVPYWLHLFIASTAFLAATAPAPVPSAPSFFDVVTAGPAAVAIRAAAATVDVVVGPTALAAAITLGAMTLVELGLSLAIAAGWSVVTATATIVWPLARAVPVDGVTAALLMAMIHLSLRLRRRPSKVDVAVFAMTLLVATLVRSSMVLMAPLFVVVLLAGTSLPERLSRWWLVLAVTGSLLVFVALSALVVTPEHLAVLAAGCAPWRLLGRIWSLVAAPGRSLFLYSPPLLLMFVGLRVLGRRDPMAARLLGGLCLLGAVVAVTFTSNAGEPPWRSEPLLPFVVVAMLPVAFAVEERRRWTVAGVSVVGMAVQMVAVKAGPIVVHECVGTAVEPMLYHPERCLLHRAVSVLFSSQHMTAVTTAGLLPYALAGLVVVAGVVPLVLRIRR